MKKESKFRKLGRLEGKKAKLIIDYVVFSKKRGYVGRFLRELGNYSFRYHKQEEERHEGCKSWINHLGESVDYRNPEQHAILVKAEMDALQQKRHARNYYLGFLESF